MKYFSGIDVGSTTIKIVILDEAGAIAAKRTSATGNSFYRNTLKSYETILLESGISPDAIKCLVSTGYGRKLLKEADDSISEITANAVGARAQNINGSQIRTIINIGGQDLKAIQLDEEGDVAHFVMNDKCAAGTGRFLEMTAGNLEVELSELGALHLTAEAPPAAINSTCTVFAESELISLLAEGHQKAELAAGIHYSIARRIVRLAKRLEIKDAVLFDGGPALNTGLVHAIEDELMHQVIVPEDPFVTTALGAAVIAQEIWQKEGDSLYA